MTTSQRVTRWLIFGVIIAVSPLIAAYLFAVIKGGHPAYSDIVGTGELFLLSIALCGAAMGDLVSGAGTKRELKFYSGGCTLVVLVLSALLYAGVSEARLSDTQMDAGMVSVISTILFAVGLVSCGCCVALSEA